MLPIYSFFSVKLKDGPLKKFIEEAKNMSPEEAGRLLQSSDIARVHDDVAEEGQTKVCNVFSFFLVFFVQKLMNIRSSSSST